MAAEFWLLHAGTCIRPEELAFKWSDLKVATKQLWIVRAVNRGKFHTPKYHRGNRPLQLTDADVERLGHSRPDLILRRYAHLLQESADVAASTLSLMVGGKSAALDGVMQSWLPEVGSQTAATASDSALEVVEGVGGAGQNRTGE